MKIGRNNPCPCGSLKKDGKIFKYKYCCLNFPYFRKRQKIIFDRIKEDHNNFLLAHKNNNCYLCGLEYSKLDLNYPCNHWMLRPCNIKKDILIKAIETNGLEYSSMFLKWLANTIDPPYININDLPEEGDVSKIIDWTIKYKNFKWGFSCGQGDLEGHKDSEVDYPHFHFQMEIDGYSFIKYNDFHIPLSEYDLFMLEVKQGKNKNYKYTDAFGMGMKEAFEFLSNQNEPYIGMKPAQNLDNGQFRFQTLIEDNSGNGIDFEEINKIMVKARQENKTMSELAEEIPNVNILRIISPADSVIEKGSRNKRK